MNDAPSTTLVEMLERLRLATAGQLRSVEPHVRRLAGDLPLLDSVWVDALAQARLLTPYQASEINSGRGCALKIGSYVIDSPLGEDGFAAYFCAHHLETSQVMHLALVERLHCPLSECEKLLTQLVRNSAQINPGALRPIMDAGIAEGKAWAVCQAVGAMPAIKWMVERGRFLPAAAEHLARQLASAMRELERVGIWHGNLSAGSVWITNEGSVSLPMPGLRACLRPHEGYAFADLPPAAFDSLAPERIAEGASISAKTELYAWGCTVWHLLTGRPPFAGGNSLAKLQTVHAARLVDARQIAPDCEEILCNALDACLRRDPSGRPKSIAELVDLLGPASRQGSEAIVRCLQGNSVWQHGLSGRGRPKQRSRSLAAAIVVLLVATAVGSSPLWRPRSSVKPTVAASATSNRTQLARSETPIEQNKDHPTTAAGDVGRLDAQVRPASNNEVVYDKTSQPTSAMAQNSKNRKQPTPASERQRVYLPTDRLLKLASLRIEPGQVVTGRAGERPRVQAPADGLLVDCDDVIFENVDFVGVSGGRSRESGAIISLQAATATFVNCTFHGAATAPSVAIDWRSIERKVAAGCELRLFDCMFYRVAAGVQSHTGESASLEIANTLLAESGPLVRLDRWPPSHASIELRLDHVTLRRCGAAVEVRYESLPANPGRIGVIADACVLDPRDALLAFVSDLEPNKDLHGIEWNGQGSLVTPQSAIAVWSVDGRQLDPISEDAIEVAGLVRSDVEFAGSISADRAASRVVDWQAPLRTDDPPGIGPTAVGVGRERFAP